MNSDTRSDEELNRVIAEWCGWIAIHRPEIYEYNYKSPDGSFTNTLPNYCNDSNAMDEAERGTAEIITLTARQRAEALVAVIENIK